MLGWIACFAMCWASPGQAQPPSSSTIKRGITAQPGISAQPGLPAQPGNAAQPANILAQLDAAAQHPLVKLNQASRAIYNETRANMLAQARPVIILAGDRLILNRGERQITAPIASSDYDHLKAFAHIALALDAALIDLPENGGLIEPKRQQLQQYDAAIEAAAETIDSLGLSEEQAQRQQKIAAAAREFIRQILSENRCLPARRQSFLRDLSPLIMANVSDAAEATLKAMDAVVQRWKQDLAPAEWKQLRVIVMGRQLPRKDSLAVQYFAWLLGTEGEGERIIYAEGIPDEEGALKLLGTHLIDTQVSIDFFDDSARMKRDLLGDAAAAVLKQWTEAEQAETASDPVEAP